MRVTPDDDLGLLVAEGFHGVDAHGAVGRDVAGEEGGGQEQGGDGQEGDGVGGADVDEEAGEDAGYAEGGEDANGDAGADEDGGVAEDEGEDAGRVSAQGHADAHFVGAAGGVVGDDAVDAHDGEDEAENAERACEGGAHFVEEEAVGAHQGFFHGHDVIDGDIGIEVVNLSFDHGDECVGWDSGAELEDVGGLVCLGDGQVEVETAWIPNDGNASVVGNADDGDGSVFLCFTLVGEPAADRILAGPEALGEGFADDGDELGIAGVGVGEGAAGEDCDAHVGEVLGADQIAGGTGGALVFVEDLAFGADAAAHVVVAERDGVGERSGLDAGEQFGAAEDLAIEGFGAGAVVALEFRIEADVEQVAGVVAEVDGLGVLQAAGEESGGDENDNGAGDLSDDEGVAEDVAAAAFADEAAAGFAQGLVDVGA